MANGTLWPFLFGRIGFWVRVYWGYMLTYYITRFSAVWGADITHRPLSSSFLRLPHRILHVNHKEELLRGLWVFEGVHLLLFNHRECHHHEPEEACRIEYC